MAVTPLDILHREFGRSFRGYRDQEVQQFLRQVSQAYENVVTENVRMKEQLENQQQRLTQYERIEDTIQNALVVAQRTAEETKYAAQKNAELLLAEAESHRRHLVEKAQAEVAETEGQLTSLRQLRLRFELEFKGQLELYRQLLENHEAGTGADLFGDSTQPTETKSPEIEKLLSDSASGEKNGNGNGVTEEDYVPRSKLIDWRLVDAHLEAAAESQQADN